MFWQLLKIYHSLFSMARITKPARMNIRSDGDEAIIKRGFLKVPFIIATID